MNGFKNFRDIVYDENAKSLAYYWQAPITCVTQEIIAEMKRVSVEYKTNLRLNLHSDCAAAAHDMIILHKSGMNMVPHKHRGKSETCHIIEGSHEVILFDNSGIIINRVIMTQHENSILRIEPDIYHLSKPITEVVIFHESKNGPFVQGMDHILATWQ